MTMSHDYPDYVPPDIKDIQEPVSRPCRAHWELWAQRSALVLLRVVGSFVEWF